MGLFRRSSEASSDDSAEATSPATSARTLARQAASLQEASQETSSDVSHGGKNEEMNEMREAILEMHRVINEVAERGTAQEKVFDVLHQELQEYKNDFIYEHLKPVLWPLLFLFDSLEQYAREIVQRVSASNESQLEAKEVLDHLKFFRGQLVEALRICEVTPMKQPSGVIDPKSHKGIGVERVDDPLEDNMIRRVVRTGWYLNGKVLRHAEVIIGKTADSIREQQAAAQTAAQVAAAQLAAANAGLSPASSNAATSNAATSGAPPKLSGNLLRAAETLRTSSDASASGGGGGS